MNKKVETYNVPLIMYLNEVKDGTISDDQDVQRKFCSKNSFIDGLGVTALTGEVYLQPIILGDIPYDNGTKQTYIVDGVQRTAALMRIRFGRHKFSSNTMNSIIEYQTKQKDDDGKVCRDENGCIIWENKTFDIRRKTFDDFPEELKNAFDSFQLNVARYPNCTMEKISELVRIYNDQNQMNASQKSLTWIPRFANVIKNIADSSFFKDSIKPSDRERVNGTYERSVCESVMTSFFLDQWKKNPKQMSAFLNDNCTVDMLKEIQSNFNELSELCDDNFYDLFITKDIPVWMAVYQKFKNLDVEKHVFINFMNRFKNYLHSIIVDEYQTSWDELADTKKSTKDKSVITLKIDIITYFLMDYLDLNQDEIVEENNTEIEEHDTENENVELNESEPNEEKIKTIENDSENIINDKECEESVNHTENNVDESNENQDSSEIDNLSFVRENVDPSITEDDIDDYWADLEEYDIDKESRLLDFQNEPSLLAIVAYSYKNDIVLDDWIKEYFEQNKMYFIDQKRNYLHMKENLNEYLQLQAKQTV